MIFSLFIPIPPNSAVPVFSTITAEPVSRIS
jgi:hypothetical protein